MRAVCWFGPRDVRVERVRDPEMVNPRDAIIRVTSTAICGSDLHLYNGFIPTMRAGDVLGHEFMGEVIEVGSAVTGLSPGTRVVVPFPIACGACWFCRQGLTSACDNGNPNAEMAEALHGFSGAGLFGYSHLYGGYPGGQAELVRVPFADVGPFPVPSRLSDEQALFLTDIFPTGYMAAENCGIRPGDTVAVWGCGPVGLFAIASAYALGADRVIAIDRWPARLRRAETHAQAETLDYGEVDDVVEELKQRTGGRGPDACIDAVGMEAHGATLDAFYDRAKQVARLGTDRPHALRQALQACRKGGTVSIPGVYGGLLDKIPFGAAFAKGLTLKMGQTHVHRSLPTLLAMIESGRIDPSFVISHRWPLSRAAEAYRMFNDKADDCTKVVLNPAVGGRGACSSDGRRPRRPPDRARAGHRRGRACAVGPHAPRRGDPRAVRGAGERAPRDGEPMASRRAVGLAHPGGEGRGQHLGVVALVADAARRPRRRAAESDGAVRRPPDRAIVPADRLSAANPRFPVAAPSDWCKFYAKRAGHLSRRTAT